MLEEILNVSFGKFLKNDIPELLEKKDKIVKEILAKEEIEEIFLDDRIIDVCCDYETIAFRAGFLAAIKCCRSLLLEEVVGFDD